LPEADGVVDEINAGAAFGDLIGANHFLEMNADFGGSVGHGKADKVGVFFEAAPVALVGKSFAAGDAQRGENAPAADEPRLAGRKPYLFDGQQAVVMKDVAVNHWLSSGAK